MRVPDRILPLPEGVASTILNEEKSKLPKVFHPGLLLDKFVRWHADFSYEPSKNKNDPDPRTNAVYALDAVVDATNKILSAETEHAAPLLLATLHRRRADIFAAQHTLGSAQRQFEAKTAGPLTLHLARAGALENAGLCLHPVYGFVYLPGSGLKGMARAYAITTGEDEVAIAQVFGRPPGKARAGTTADPGCRGAVVFHDAWPKQWPELVRDIVNNHHSSYYHSDAWPGDWDEPVPVNFLAVPEGVTFSFALTGNDSALVELAARWLKGALVYRGAGAKTNAGYGGFELVGEPAPAAPRSDLRVEATLELVTPGFFGGAELWDPRLAAKTCDLRPASLRGQLRWWWRAMQGEKLAAQPETERLKWLKERERLIWGDTKRAGAVRVSVSVRIDARSKRDVRDYDKQAERKPLRLPSPQPPLRITGLAYAGYGMDKKIEGQPRRRHAVCAGARWTIVLTVRPAACGLEDRENVLDEARAALWLLSRYGGVGAKHRKGFGGFKDLPADFDFAKSFQMRTEPGADVGFPALCGAFGREWTLGSTAPVAVIDSFGAALQKLAIKYKHDEKKKALGLPRKIHGPDKRRLPCQKSHTPPLSLSVIAPDLHAGAPVRRKIERHAAPYVFHVGKDTNGNTVARFTAFPSSVLPNLNASKAMLQELIGELESFGPGASAAPPHGRITGGA